MRLPGEKWCKDVGPGVLFLLFLEGDKLEGLQEGLGIILTAEQALGFSAGVWERDGGRGSGLF